MRNMIVTNRKRDKRWANDNRIFGVRKVYDDPAESDPEGPHKIYYFRSRKARRAQARIEKKRWRDLSEHERLVL